MDSLRHIPLFQCFLSVLRSHHVSELPKHAKPIIPPHFISEIMKLDGQSSIIKLKGVLYSICAMLDDNSEYVKKKALENGLIHSIFDFVEKNKVDWGKKTRMRNFEKYLPHSVIGMPPIL